ncbi:hypothetical protein ACOTDT_19100 [Achromobacter xylosoxidans]|nr:hypothetical protein EC609_19055 [Achromobacter denitrificans]
MTASSKKVDGFRSAEAWHVSLCEAAKASKGFFFPSLLRECFTALPETAQGDFLDGIGALMVSWEVVGRPVPGKQNLRNSASLCAMSPEQQDAWAEEHDEEEGERA